MSNHGGKAMPTKLRYSQCCVVIDCLKPARELGGFCTPCFQSLLAEERAILRREAEQPTVPLDTEAISNSVCDCTGLEAALLLEFTDDLRPAA